MVGVSTTLIGLVKVAKGHMGPSRVDEYAGLAALLFLSAVRILPIRSLWQSYQPQPEK